MSHVEHLSETIGPRPAATDSEEQAARYIGEVFEARGLESQTQSFDTPRSSGWAFALYHLLTILAAVLSHFSALPALVLGLMAAVVMWLDLDTRWGLTSLMPKGPIGRPKSINTRSTSGGVAPSRMRFIASRWR